MTFDPLWLAVLKAFNYRMSSDPWNGSIPEGDMPSLERELEESICWVKTHVKDEGRLSVEEVQKFSKTAPSTQDYVDKSEPRTRTPLSHSESDRLILSGSHDFLQPANPSSVRSSGNREPNTSRGVGEIT